MLINISSDFAQINGKQLIIGVDCLGISSNQAYVVDVCLAVI